MPFDFGTGPQHGGAVPNRGPRRKVDQLPHLDDALQRRANDSRGFNGGRDPWVAVWGGPRGAGFAHRGLVCSIHGSLYKLAHSDPEGHERR